MPHLNESINILVIGRYPLKKIKLSTALKDNQGNIVTYFHRQYGYNRNLHK